MDQLKKSLGYQYLKDTKFSRATIHLAPELEIKPTTSLKKYPDKDSIKLPAINLTGQDNNIWDLLALRRSKRKYRPLALSDSDLALLCWACQGITAQAGSFRFRTAPSAGALYPIETYLAINNCSGIQPGFFHLEIDTFKLHRLTNGPPGQLLAHAALNQNFLGNSSVVFIWSAILRRNMCKYKHRGLRYILMDVGHICQNLLLAAQALNLSACPVGAFFDEEINDLLALDGEEESVIYMAAVGATE